MDEALNQCRARIDELDLELLRLVNERATLAQEIGTLKRAGGAEDNSLYRPEREARVLRRVMEANEGPLDDETVAQFFRQVMSSCLALEEPQRIAFLGPAGTFTHEAALKHFGDAIVVDAQPRIEDVFREVEAKRCAFGVVPIENNTEGAVHHTLDQFRSSNLQICGEVEVRVHQNLLAPAGRAREEIVRVYSHPQSLAQCRAWLDTHLPHAERVEARSNAEAAQLAVQEPGSAAVAGLMAAKLYDLELLGASIEDQPDNTTRFLVIGHHEVPASGKDKTSILVTAREKPGALYHLLKPFQREGVTLTRLQTRPARTSTWGYVFFMDLEGSRQDPPVRRALEALAQEAGEVKILGSYPQAVL